MQRYFGHEKYCYFCFLKRRSCRHGRCSGSAGDSEKTSGRYFFQLRLHSSSYIANVALSVFPSEKAVETVKNVNDNVKAVRFDFGQRVRHQLRIIPEFRFFVDDSLDYLEHIDELLKK